MKRKGGVGVAGRSLELEAIGAPEASCLAADPRVSYNSLLTAKGSSIHAAETRSSGEHETVRGPAEVSFRSVPLVDTIRNAGHSPLLYNRTDRMGELVEISRFRNEFTSTQG